MVAIPLRGSIPCNLGAAVPEPTAFPGRNPLTGLNPLQLRLDVVVPGRLIYGSQSPYRAQSLATEVVEAGGDGAEGCRNPLTGLNPLQHPP